MLYDNYRAKVQKFAAVVKWVAIHKILLIAIGAAIIALLSTFLGVKGTVVDSVEQTELGSLTYGETLDYSASAVFGKVYYEYSFDGVNWSTDLPTLPGKNYVRAVSKRSFGAKGYGKVHSFVIEKRPITVDITSDAITYGFDPAIATDLAYSDKIYCDKFIYDDITSSFTLVTPDVSSIRIMNSDGNDAAACYDITVNGKQLYIYKRGITLIADSAEKEYDAVPLVKPSFTLDGTLAFDDVISVTVSGSATNYTDAGSNIIESYKITSANGKDVSSQYDVTKLSGTLTITRKRISVETGSLTAEYDGSEKFQSSFALSAETPLVAGQRLRIGKESLCTRVTDYVDGGYENVLDLVVESSGGEDVSSNYIIDQVSGRIIVTRRKIALTTADATFTYTGGAQSDDSEPSYAYGSKTLVAGQSFVFDNRTSITNVSESGTVLNKFDSVRIIAADGTDKTDNYEISSDNYGKLYMNKDVLTFYGKGNGDAHFIYSGTPQYVRDYDESAEQKSKLISRGHSVVVDEYVSVTDSNEGVGTENVITVHIEYADGRLNDNYEITYGAHGKIYVDRRPVSVFSENAEKIYDGTPLENETLNVDYLFTDMTGDGLCKGHTAKATFTGALTDVGVTDNFYSPDTFSIKDGSGADKTYNYNVKVFGFGVLTVVKRPISVLTASSTDIVFDGQSHKNTDYTVTGAYDLVLGHKLSVISSTEATFVLKVGGTVVSTPNEFVFDVVDASGNDKSEYGNALIDNYDITLTAGEIKINPRPIDISSANAEKVYDGIALGYAGFDVTAHYDAATEKVVYNADNGTLDYYSANGNTPLYSEIVTVYNFASIRGAGETDNTFEYGFSSSADNYSVNLNYGRLKVDKRAIKIGSSSADKIYDASPLISDGFTISFVNGNGDAAPADATYNEIFRTIEYSSVFGDNTEYFVVSFTGTRTDVGASPNAFDISFYEDAYGNVSTTPNYEITGKTEGTLTVEKRPIRVYPEDVGTDGTLIYDGNPHTSRVLLVEPSESADYGLIGGHYVESFETDNSISDAVSGVCKVKAETVVIKDGTGKVVSTNYDIVSASEATIVVSPRPIAIKAKGASGENAIEYNGANNVVYAAEAVTAGHTYGLVEGHAITAVCSGNVKNVGVVVNEIVSFDILDGSGNSVKANYAVDGEWGTDVIEVVPRKVEVTTANASKVYDGTALHDFSCMVTGGSFVSGDKLSALTGRYLTSVGSTENEVFYAVVDSLGNEIAADGFTVADNYDITFCYGMLTVTKRRITVSSGSAKKTYDATGLSAENYSVSIDKSGVATISYDETSGIITYDFGEENLSERLSVEFSDEMRVNVGVYDNIFSWKTENEYEDTSDNYEVTAVYGKLTIEKRKLTIRSGDYEGEYDAKRHTAHDYTLSLDVSGGADAYCESENGNVIVYYGSVYEDLVVTFSADSYAKIFTDTAKDNAFTCELYNGYAITTDNYEITRVFGKLKVYKRALEIRTFGKVFVFNGEYQRFCSEDAYAVIGGSLAEDEDGVYDQLKVDVSASASIRNVADSGAENVIAFYITDEELGDVSVCYDISLTEKGLLEVAPRPITIKAKDASKIYDGEPLVPSEAISVNDIGELNEGLVGGHAIGAEFIGEALDANEDGEKSYGYVAEGSVRITYLGKDETANYDITVSEEPCNLTVYRRPVLLKLTDVTKLYDGTPAERGGYEVVYYEGGVENLLVPSLVKDHRIEFGTTATPETVADGRVFVDVVDGSCNVFTYDEYADEWIIVSDNYDVSARGAWYSVERRKFFLNLFDLEKVYDGTPLDYSAVYDSYDVYSSASVFCDDKKESISIDRAEGKAYDYIIRYYPFAAINGNGGDLDPYNEEYVTITVSGSITDAGSIYNTVDIRFFANEDLTEEVTGCYDPSDSYLGLLTVTPRRVEIITAGNEDEHFVYNGEYRYVREFAIGDPTPMADGHRITVAEDAWEGVKHVGDSGSVNRFDLGGITVYDEYDGVVASSNYEFTFSSDCGKLYVDKKGLTITTATSSFVYDGKEHYDLSFTEDGLVDGEIVKVIKSGFSKVAFVDEGSIENRFFVAVTAADGSDSSGDYEYTYVYGTLDILPRRIRLKPEDISEVYSGRTFAPEKVVAIVGEEVESGEIVEYFDIAEGDEIEALIEGSARYVTDSPATAYIIDILSITRGDRDVSSCYEIAYYETGVIEIVRRGLTITTASASKYYDGTPLSNELFTAETLADGDYIEQVVFCDGSRITEVGRVDNAVYEDSVVIFDEYGEDVTENYDIGFIFGTLEVSLRGMTIVAASDEKIYDGLTLEKDECIVSVEYDGDGEYVEVVTEQGIVYDRPYTHILNYYDRTREVSVKTQYVYAAAQGSILNVGTARNVVGEYYVFDETGDVGGYYGVKTVDGVLKVNVRKVYVTVEGEDFGEYDGEEHYHECLPVVVYEYGGRPLADAYDLVEGQYLTVGGWKRIRYAGTVENSFSYWSASDGASDTSKNYDVVIVGGGSLVIGKRKVDIATRSFDGGYIEYDGAEHTLPEYDVLNGSFVEGEVIGVSGTTVKEPNGYGVENRLVFSIGSYATGTYIDVGGSYDIKIVSYGTLKVVKRSITVAANGEEFVYDGREHYLNKGVADRAVAGHTIRLESDVSRKTVGVTENVLPKEGSVIVFDEYGNDVTDCYEIMLSSESAYISVIKRSVILVPSSRSWEYDGNEHTLFEATTSPSSPYELAERHSIAAEYSGVIKNVGSVFNEFVGGKENVFIFDEELEDVTENYDVISTGVGTLTVTARKITLETGSYDRVYDGMAHDRSDYNGVGYAISFGSLAEGQRIELKDGFAFASVKGVTDVPVVNAIDYSIKDGDEDVTSNYDVTENFGLLAVRKRAITIKTFGGGFVYDGKAHDGSDYNGVGYAITEGSIADGEQTVIETPAFVSVKYVSEGKALNFIEVDITDGAVSVADNYTITYDYGYIYIVARPIEIKTATWEDFLYNGKFRSYPYFEEGFDMESVDLADGERIEYSLDGWAKIKYVGTIDNTVEVTVLHGETAVTDNYDISFTGKLTVRPLPITINVDGGVFVYDGDDHIVKTFSLVTGAGYNDLPDGHYFDMSATEALASVNEVTEGVVNDLGFVIREGSGEIVPNENFSIHKQTGANDGLLVVVPREIKVRPKNVSKVYDGEPLVCSEGETTGGTTLAKSTHRIAIKTDAALTDVGVAATHVVDYNADNSAIAVYDGKGRDISRNYRFIDWSAEGVLEVTPRPITVMPEDSAHVYDGLPHGATKLLDVSKNADSGLISGHRFEQVEFYGYALNVSDGSVTTGVVTRGDGFALAVIDGNGNDVTGNYSVTLIEGRVSITPRRLYVETASAEKIYDGEALTATDILSFESEAQADVVVSGENGNYEIFYIDSGATHYISVTAIGSVTDVSDVFEHNNEFIFFVENESGDDVSANYVADYSRCGTLVIGKRPVKIVYYGADLGEYDGLAHRNERADYESVGEGRGVLDGYSVEFSGWRSVTDANDMKAVNARAKNSARIAVYAEVYDGKDRSGNYEFEITYDEEYNGVLTLRRRKIKIVTSPDALASTVVYNGAEQYDTSFDIVEGSVADGQKISVSSFDRFKDANEDGYENVLGFAIRDIARPYYARTQNYDIEVESGRFYIMKRKVDLVAKDKTEYYDGNAHFITEAAVSVASEYSLVAGHTVSVVTIGSLTAVGVRNDILIDESQPITFYDAYGNDVSDNYFVNMLNAYPATLEVLKRPIVVKAGDAEKEYDGTPLTYAGYSITSPLGEALAHGQTASVVIDGSITDYDENGADNVVVSVEIYDGDVRVTDYYDVVYEKGLLTIVKRAIKVVTGSAEKIYDAAALVKEEARLVYVGETPYASALVSDHEAEFTGYREITNVWESGDNTVNVTIRNGEGVDKTFNYRISYDFGTLNIMPVEIVYSTPSCALPLTYNGEYQGVDGSVVTILKGGLLYGVNGAYHTFTDERFTREMNVGTYENEYFFDVIDEGGESVKGNYSFTAENGSFTIVAKRVVVETENDRITYDGTVHYYEDYYFLNEIGERIEASEALAPTDSVESVKRFGVINATETAGVANEITLTVVKNSVSGENVIGNYDIEYRYGKVTVDKRGVRLKVADEDVVYDGETHRATGGESVYEDPMANVGLVKGHSVTLSSYQEYFDAVENAPLTADMNSVMVFNEWGADVTANYTILNYGEFKRIGDGSITIRPRPIYIRPADVRKTYDGNMALSVNEAEIVDENGLKNDIVYGLADKDRIEAIVSGSGLFVGSYKTGIVSYKIYSSYYGETRDVTSNYVVTALEGSLIVYARTIDYSSGSAEKVYDGEPLRCEEVTITSGEFAAGDAPTYSFPSLTDIGSIENRVTFTVRNAVGEDVTFCYDFIDNGQIGTLTVIADESNRIVCYLYEIEETYDGTEYRVEPKKFGAMPEGVSRVEILNLDYFVLINAGKITCAELNANSSYVVYDLNGEPVNGYSVEFRTASGKDPLVVQPAELEIKAKSTQKEYDGKPLVCSDYEILTGELIDGDVITSVTYSGEQTARGSSKCEITEVVIMRDGIDVTKNYRLIFEPGTLTVK